MCRTCATFANHAWWAQMIHSDLPVLVHACVYIILRTPNFAGLRTCTCLLKSCVLCVWYQGEDEWHRNVTERLQNVSDSTEHYQPACAAIAELQVE